jgi:hypothetical protein
MIATRARARNPGGPMSTPATQPSTHRLPPPEVVQDMLLGDLAQLNDPAAPPGLYARDELARLAREVYARAGLPSVAPAPLAALVFACGAPLTTDPAPAPGAVHAPPGWSAPDVRLYLALQLARLRLAASPGAFNETDVVQLAAELVAPTDALADLRAPDGLARWSKRELAPAWFLALRARQGQASARRPRARRRARGG